MEIAIRNNGLDNLSGSLSKLKIKLSANRTALGAAIRALNVTGGDSSYTASARQQLQKRLRQEDARMEAVTAAQRDIDSFVEYTRGVDHAVAQTVEQKMEAFLAAHAHLRPAAEKPWYRRAFDTISTACKKLAGAVADGFAAAVAFIVEHGETISRVINGALIVIGVVTTIAAVALTALSGGTLAGVGAVLLKIGVTSLKCGLAGAAIGGVIGGAAGGITTRSWEGAAAGAWEGAKSGFIGGALGGFAGGGIAALKAGWASAVAFTAKGGKLSFNNFSWRTYQTGEVYTVSRPGSLASPDVLPEERITHEFLGNRTGGGHVLNVPETGRTLQNAAALEQVPGQPAGVYNATFAKGGSTVTKTCWPNSYSPARVMDSMDEAYRAAVSGNGRILLQQGDRVTYLVQLKDRIVTRIAVNTRSGELITCFPEGKLENIRLLNTIR